MQRCWAGAALGSIRPVSFVRLFELWFVLFNKVNFARTQDGFFHVDTVTCII
jgi:hypothetical protein